MLTEVIYNLFEFIAVFVIAGSSAQIAVEKKMDFVGVNVVAVLPAIGGGTTRDLILDLPVWWLHDKMLPLATLAASTFVFFMPKRWLGSQILIWFDAVGLALFAVVGCQKTFDIGGGYLLCLFMGVLTAVGGGLIRDLICNRPPLFFKSDIYALAPVVGASVCYVLLISGVSSIAAMSVGALIAFSIRFASVKYSWTFTPRT
ncbi:trimeric intracellular cation channel family protein [Microbulbifer agarilyticus]